MTLKHVECAIALILCFALPNQSDVVQLKLCFYNISVTFVRHGEHFADIMLHSFEISILCNAERVALDMTVTAECSQCTCSILRSQCTVCEC